MAEDLKFRVPPLQGEGDYSQWYSTMVNVWKMAGVFKFILKLVVAPVIPDLAENGNNIDAVTLAETLHQVWEAGTAKVTLLTQQALGPLPLIFCQQKGLFEKNPFELVEALKGKYSLSPMHSRWIWRRITD
jgi:hypothetical protein